MTRRAAYLTLNDRLGPLALTDRLGPLALTDRLGPLALTDSLRPLINSLAPDGPTLRKCDPADEHESR